MKNLKIGKKLGISFIVLLMLTAFANFYALSNLKKAGKLSHDLFKGPYVITNQTMGIRRDVAAIDDNLTYAIACRNPTDTIIKLEFWRILIVLMKELKYLRENYSRR